MLKLVQNSLLILINDICKKTGLILNALSRIIPNLGFKKKKIWINAIFMSQFNYSRLIWMCSNPTKSNKINRLHERCLRLLYKYKKLSIHDLLEKDSSVSIHHRKLKTLATEMHSSRYCDRDFPFKTRRLI